MKILIIRCQVNRIDLSNADLIVEDAALSYGNGIYWFPSHEFNIVIPKLTVSSPRHPDLYNDAGVSGWYGIFATETRSVPDHIINNKMLKTVEMK